MIWLTVPPELAQKADRLGRELAHHRERAIHRNNLRTSPEENERLHILGRRAEAALYCFFGGKKGGAEWITQILRNSKGVCNLTFRGEKYDARGIAENHLALVVYPTGVYPSWRYVLVATEFWPRVGLAGWCTGEDISVTPLREKVRGRAAYFIEQEDRLIRSCKELRPDLPDLVDEPDGYILQDRDGDYVSAVESTGWETVRFHFVFSKERKDARVFSYKDLFWKQATNPLGIDFLHGFAGGRAIRVGQDEA